MYCNEAKSKRSSELHYNYNTFKRMLYLCISEGLIKITKKGHYQAISNKNILTYMNDGVIKEKNLTFNKYVKFFKKYTYEGTVTPKIIYEQVIKSLILKNYTQQQYNIDKIKKKLEVYESSFYRTKSASKSDLRLVRKLAKEASVKKLSTADYVKSLKEKNKTIVSGKYHVSNIIKMSSTTGSRYLKKLSEREVKRKIIKTRINLPLNNASFESLKATHLDCTVIPVQSLNCFYVYKGSEIEIMGDFTLNSFAIQSKQLMH